MSDINRGDLGEIPRRLFQIVANGNPVPILSPIMMAALVLEQDRPEWRYFSSQKLCAARAGTEAAAAGAYSAVNLYNPATSKSLAVVTNVTVNGGSGGCDIVPSFTSLGGAVTNVTVRDTRWVSAPLTLGKPQCVLYHGNTVGAPPEPRCFLVGANVTWSITDAYILQPGTSLWVITSLVNNSVGFANFAWYERPITADDLR